MRIPSILTAAALALTMATASGCAATMYPDNGYYATAPGYYGGATYYSTGYYGAGYYGANGYYYGPTYAGPRYVGPAYNPYYGPRYSSPTYVVRPGPVVAQPTGPVVARPSGPVARPVAPGHFGGGIHFGGRR